MNVCEFLSLSLLVVRAPTERALSESSSASLLLLCPFPQLSHHQVLQKNCNQWLWECRITQHRCSYCYAQLLFSHVFWYLQVHRYRKYMKALWNIIFMSGVVVVVWVFWGWSVFLFLIQDFWFIFTPMNSSFRNGKIAYIKVNATGIIRVLNTTW